MEKILVIPGGLQIGGAEKVAADICCYAPNDEFEFQYLVFEGNENVYGPEIEKHGGKVFYWPTPSTNYAKYVRDLNKLMKEQCYSAIHSHTMFNSGINLLIARKNKIPVRIAHSHTTKTEKRVSLFQKIYEILMRVFICMFATHYFACGNAAGEWLFGKKAFSKKGRVIRNGIDTQIYSFSEESRTKIRAELKINDCFVVGHSGTLIPLKNQKFLISLMPEVLKHKPNAVLVLLGDGDPEQIDAIKKAIAEYHMESHVILCGGVPNVYEYLNAFDVFAFPSLREGTPLALIEAQTNGLPCIVSDCVPRDVYITDAIKFLSLQEKDAWVRAICSADRAAFLGNDILVSDKGYDVHKTYAPIYKAYRRCNNKALVALSFDDGRADNYRVVNDILSPLSIPATFNITSGYVDNSCPEELKPTALPAMTIDEITSLDKDDRFEIALHGNNHLNTCDDVAAGRQKIIKWLNRDDKQRFGFASPGCRLKVDDRSFLCKEPFKSGVSYVRVGLRYKSFAWLKILFRKAGRVIHFPLFFRLAYSDTLMSQSDGRILYSVPIMGDTTAHQVIGLLNLCIRKHSAVILMLHSIEKNPHDTWSWNEKKFIDLCEFLSQKNFSGELKAVTVEQLYDDIK